MYTEPDINKKVKILSQSIEEAMRNIRYKIVKMKKNDLKISYKNRSFEKYNHFKIRNIEM